MKKTALLATRDPSGLNKFAGRLAEEFGYQLLWLASIGPAPLPRICQAIELEEAERAIREGRIPLLVANFWNPTVGVHRGYAWKKAMAEMDHDIVGLVRTAAIRPSMMGVVGDARQYSDALDLLEAGPAFLPESFRVQQACNALHAVAAFDAAVAQFLESQSGEAPDLNALSGYPKTLYYSWKRDATLKGASVQQMAAVYGGFGEHFETISGPALDYASLLDLSLATYAIGEFEKPTALLISKGQLMAGSSASELVSALKEISPEAKRLRESALLVVNGSMDPSLLAEFSPTNFSSIVAPSFRDFDSERGPRLIASKEGLGYESLQEIRSIAGGLLVQDKNRVPVDPMAWRIPSGVQPLVYDWETMIFGVKLVRHVQSSACLAVQNERMVLLASHLTTQFDFERAFAGNQKRLDGAILVFDEDLEGPDILDAAKRQGAYLVIHPGLDSDREAKLVERSNELGIGLVATGIGLAKL